jgi:hypothetical protein
MPINRIFTGACLLGLLACWPVFGAQTRFDGHLWRESDLQTRQLFIYSFVSGIVQGQDRVARQLLVTGGEGFRPECHKAVSQNINRLETEMGQFDRNLFINALDAFYERKKNRPLELKWALLVVMQQLKGTSPADLDRYIEMLKQEGR